VKIYDMHGNERDWAWAHERFGAIALSCSDANPPYRATKLYEIEGPTDLNVYVYGENGDPEKDIEVAFYWPDAPFDSGAPSGFRRCITGKTNAEGRCGFAMGGGAYYWPPGGGPHAVWLYGDQLSEIVSGLGMLGGTNHIHLNVVYQKINTSEPPPPPSPPPPESGDCEENLRQALAALEVVQGSARGIDQYISEFLQELGG